MHKHVQYIVEDMIQGLTVFFSL